MCLSLKHYALKMSAELEVYIQAFLTSELDGVCGQLHAPAVLSSGKEHSVPIWEDDV
jgi:hypothetical protein